MTAVVEPAGLAGGYPGGGAPVAEFVCNACDQGVENADEYRKHCKSERHVYNTKRRLAGLKPISQEAWDRKIREARDNHGPGKGKAHLKAGKPVKESKKSESVASTSQSATPAAGGPASATAASAEGTEAAEGERKEEEQEQLPFNPRRCLFSTKEFSSIHSNLEYMWKHYNFCIPDREYCVSEAALLEFLWRKTNEPGHSCIYCNKKFREPQECRRHMLDMKHTRIGTQAKTRKNFVDELGSEEMQADLEQFFDFTKSSLEVTEKIRSKAEKVGCILRFFDADRDGRLDHAELSALWVAGGAPKEMSEPGYIGACEKAGADPKEGFDADQLEALYSQGLADLDAHFRVLQDALASKLAKRTKDRQAIAEEGEEGEDGEADGEIEEGVEVIECEDEDEFEEVMRVLGLQQVTILDNGDLRLPSGCSAVHRDVAHIWKQRGNRPGQLALVAGGGGARGGKKNMTQQLALADGTGGTTVAISHRQHVRHEKQYMVILRKEQRYQERVGMQANKLQKTHKVRTAMGDASGGR